MRYKKIVNTFSVRFDEYFLAKKFGQHYVLLTQVLPKYDFMLKIPVKNRPNHGMSKRPGGLTVLVLRASYCGRKDLGTCFPPFSNHIIIVYMVMNISSHEIAKKGEF